MIAHKKDLEIARKAARAGAKIVNEHFGKSNKARVKRNAKGLVTETDLAAENAIIEVLKAESDYEILSEESGTLNQNEGPKWVIDPLDGTNNFARCLPLFAVSVGLMHENQSLVGVIIDPVNKNEFYAAKNSGAFCNGKKIELPGLDKDYIPMLFLNHGYAQADRIKFREITSRLALDFNILKLGTTALELCYIANGDVDAFICSGDELWDFAAGIVIAREAGCVFTDWQGNPWDGKHSHLLISRPELQKELVKIIKDLQ
jgi:myo-inositol-1(or 4)-monophosphatase